MNVTIYECEFTGVVPGRMIKSYYEHADVPTLKTLGFKVEWSVVHLAGGAVYRARIYKGRSDRFDRSTSFPIVRKIFKDCDATNVFMCDHTPSHMQYMKVGQDVYEICKCHDCGASFKFEV
ncbi:hypothetical protein [Aeromonas phage Riv-10]|uniref:Uncharacterized protein n=2 Tax=Biquartavirus 44RR2 TaxID=115987 RepID=Q6U9P9_9CAUD|nr:hypothetical protein ST44RRORF053c [Aeromonas phage 44RR2.8t]AAQ81372.1 hypothetical protein 44RRORF053c [Aeromonas phage 44RR2.8t]APU00526.1 hypothetical protein [Aeromonas phage 44RR2.8t.2]APU01858.1 hypothetical protein [Aeromonas phage L9-6]APU02108.1 hypothetical protein [Aeromonas phage Riv-10]